MSGTIFQQWAFAKPLIEAGMQHCHGTHTIDDVCLMVGAGVFKLWIMEDSALITEFVEYPQTKTMNIWAAGGKLETLMKMRNALFDFAREKNCSMITASGRGGWERVFPESGKAGTALYWKVS